MNQRLYSLSLSLLLLAPSIARAQATAEDSSVAESQGEKEPKPQRPPATEPDSDSDESAGSELDSNATSTEPRAAEAPEQPAKEKPQAPTVDSQEAEARAAFREGDLLYYEGDYEGAVHAFERAYALSGRIEMLFNLANAHERLGNYERASVALRGYIPHAPEGHRGALEKRLERFEERASRQREQEQKTAEVVKDLKENPRPFPVERTVGIGLLTLGSAGIITGTGFAISAMNARAELDEICETGEAGRLCPPDAEGALKRDRAHSTVADVAILAGAATAVIGTVLVIRSKKKEKEKFELEIGFAPNRLTFGGAF